MYVAVKGPAHAPLPTPMPLGLDEARRGDREVPEMGADQIREQLALAVDPEVDGRRVII